MTKERETLSVEGTLKLALEKYMAAYGQALEAYGIELQQQQIEADKFAREALAQPAVGEDSKTWVGLTDEDVKWCDHNIHLIRWAEAKLKAKNFAEEKNT